jgi:signal transduction histidine kinase
MMATMEGPAALRPAAGQGDHGGHPVAALAAVGIALALGGLLLVGDDGLSAAEVVRVGLVVAWALAGLVLVLRAGQRPLGVVVLTAAALGGICVLCSGVLHRDPTGPLASTAALVRPLVAGLLPAVAFHLIVGLPDGRLASRPRRVAVGIGYTAGASLGVILWAQRPALPLWPVVAAGVLAVAAGVGPSHRRFLTTRGIVRQRMEWIGLAVVVVAEVALVVTALRVLAGWPRHIPEVVGAVSVLVPVALAAGASPRLVGRVDRLLAHTVSLAGLSGLVVVVYLLVVLGLGQVPSEGERALLLLSMVAAAVCALLYHPARERLTQAANRLVYGERSAPDEALRTFGTRLSRAIPLDELLLQLAESLHKTMALEAAEVWTGSEGLLERAASVPDRGPARLTVDPAEAPVVARAGVSGPAWLAVWLPRLLDGRHDAAMRVAPVAHSGELLGLLVVVRRPEEWFSEEDERVLAELARQVGLALHNVRLDSALQASLDELRHKAEELQASRARIVAAADAERRRIERNLHDGAQQRLVALSLELSMLKKRLDADAEASTRLDHAHSEIALSLEELRDVARGLHPAVVSGHGLAVALESLAARATVPVRLNVELEDRLPEPVEVAAYYLVSESLANIGKHAQATSATIDVTRDNGEVVVEVVDDGIGGADTERGSGLRGLADRVEALDGRLRVWTPRGHGTRVRAEIPCA